MNVDLIVPAFDDEGAISALLADVPRPPVREILVVDNGSRDATARFARHAGARIVHETRVGYGYACLAGVASLAADCDIVVFLPVTGGDPGDIPALIAPILDDRADLVVASRSGDRRVPTQQRMGNAIASRWLRARFGVTTTDLGPLRAIRRGALDALHLEDTQHGWDFEMQIKAAQHGLRYAEIAATSRAFPPPSRGTVRGALRTGANVLGLIARHDRKKR